MGIHVAPVLGAGVAWCAVEEGRGDAYRGNPVSEILHERIRRGAPGIGRIAGGHHGAGRACWPTTAARRAPHRRTNTPVQCRHYGVDEELRLATEDISFFDNCVRKPRG